MKAPGGPAWDLTELWDSPHDPALAREMADCLAQAEAFARAVQCAGPGIGGPGEFPGIVGAYEALLDRMDRVEAFADLWGAVRADDLAAESLSRRTEAFGRHGRLLARDFELALANLDDKPAASLLDALGDHPARHNLQKARLFRDHLLAPDLEALLADILSPVRTAWMAQWRELAASARAGRFSALASHPDGRVRAASQARLGKAIEPKRALFARTLAGIVQAATREDHIRGHRHWLGARCLEEETTPRAVESLMARITRDFPLVGRYYRLKARLLGRDVLAAHDRLAPPVPGLGRAVSWPATRALALAGFARLSTSLAGKARAFFERGHIDADPRPGKAPGAFCRSVGAGRVPYVLLNGSGRVRDAAVLAHELGHGLHHLLSDGLGAVAGRPPMALAEAVAVSCELALHEERLARARSDKARLAVLCQRLEDDITTVFRQAALHGFEDSLRRGPPEDGPPGPTETAGPGDDAGQADHAWPADFLDADSLDALWLSWQDRLHRDSVTGHMPGGWAVTPHFFLVPGYVHIYVRAGCLAASLWERRASQPGDFGAAFETLCASGGSKPLEELLAPFGIDPDSPDLAEPFLSRFEAALAEAEGLADDGP